MTIFILLSILLIEIIVKKVKYNCGGIPIEEYINNLNLIDLVSEKHKKLRKKTFKLWAERNLENISGAETHLLAMLSIKNMTIADCARKMNLSRQAVHKCSKDLIAQNYITFFSIEGNHRDKLLQLTDKGTNYCIKMLNLKEEIEREITENIGSENVEFLKNLLRKEW